MTFGSAHPKSRPGILWDPENTGGYLGIGQFTNKIIISIPARIGSKLFHAGNSADQTVSFGDIYPLRRFVADAFFPTYEIVKNRIEIGQGVVRRSLPAQIIQIASPYQLAEREVLVIPGDRIKVLTGIC